MSDYFGGVIQIPQKFINESEDLRNAIARESFSDDQYFEDGGIIQYGAAKALNGEFEDLEKYLQENKIPFDRSSEGYYEYDPEYSVYRPAAEGFDEIEKVFYNANDGSMVVDMARIKKILGESKSDEEIAAKVRDLVQEYEPISLEEYVVKYGDFIIKEVKS